MNRRIVSIAGAVLLSIVMVVLLAACIQVNPSTETGPASGGSITPLDGQALLQERCTVCHSLDRVTAAHKTAVEWTTTVERMVGKGARITASEQQVLIETLAQTYP